MDKKEIKSCEDLPNLDNLSDEQILELMKNLNFDLSIKNGRIAYGKVAEIRVMNDLKRRNIKLKDTTAANENITPYLDKKYGDVSFTFNRKKFNVDVKHGHTVTWSSVCAFKGEYYLFVIPNKPLSKAFFVSRKVLLSYMNEVRKSKGSLPVFRNTQAEYWKVYKYNEEFCHGQFMQGIKKYISYEAFFTSKKKQLNLLKEFLNKLK